MACFNSVGDPQRLHKDLLDLLADQVMLELTVEPDAQAAVAASTQSFFFSLGTRRQCSCAQCRAYREVLASL